MTYLCRIFAGILSLYLSVFWTCPTYCSAMSMGAVDARLVSSEVAAHKGHLMQGHEHHHTTASQPLPTTSRSMVAGHNRCCDWCGESGHALSVTEKTTAVIDAMIKAIPSTSMRSNGAIDGAPALAFNSGHASSPPGRFAAPVLPLRV